MKILKRTKNQGTVSISINFLKITLLVFILTGTLSLLSLKVFAVGGTLTQDANGFYLIYDKADFKAFASKVNGGDTYADGKLMKDITLNTNVLDTKGVLINNGVGLEPWTPIGINNANKYSGTFDGNGKIVKGVYINEGDDSIYTYHGLFGNATYATIKNLGVVDSFIKTTQNSRYLGGICGMNEGTIENCYSSATLFSSGMSTYVGGICGQSDRKGIIKNCYNTGQMTGTGSNTRIGGICGYKGEGITENCYNLGKITAVGERSMVGGINGFGTQGDIKNCFNVGIITATRTDSVSGGICGQNNSGKITNCFNYSAVTGTNTLRGGLCGKVTYDPVFTNSYYLNEYGNNDLGIAKTSAEFKKGEVAYLLNGNQSKVVFGQQIPEHSYPLFIETNGSNQVFKVTFKGVNTEVHYITKGKNITLPKHPTPDTHTYTFKVGSTTFNGTNIKADTIVTVTENKITVTPKPTNTPEKTATKIPDKTVEKTPVKTAEKTPDKTIGKTPDKTTTGTPDKTSEETPDKNTVAPTDKTTEEATDNTPDNETNQSETPYKTAEKTTAKITSSPIKKDNGSNKLIWFILLGGFIVVVIVIVIIVTKKSK